MATCYSASRAAPKLGSLALAVTFCVQCAVSASSSSQGTTGDRQPASGKGEPPSAQAVSLSVVSIEIERPGSAPLVPGGLIGRSLGFLRPSATT